LSCLPRKGSFNWQDEDKFDHSQKTSKEQTQNERKPLSQNTNRKMNKSLCKLEQSRILRESEIRSNKVELKIKMPRKLNRQTNTFHFIIIQAIDLNTKLCVAECWSNEFTLWSHSRYLKKNSQNQRTKLQHHMKDEKYAFNEKETRPTGCGLSIVGPEQISDRLLTGKYVRFPILDFDGKLNQCSSVMLQFWLAETHSDKPCLSKEMKSDKSTSQEYDNEEISIPTLNENNLTFEQDSWMNSESSILDNEVLVSQEPDLLNSCIDSQYLSTMQDDLSQQCWDEFQFSQPTIFDFNDTSLFSFCDMPDLQQNQLVSDFNM